MYVYIQPISIGRGVCIYIYIRRSIIYSCNSTCVFSMHIALSAPSNDVPSRGAAETPAQSSSSGFRV